MAYTYAQLKALWIQNGGSSASADIAAAVALAESGGDPNATNSNTNGSIDRGLWQINSVHGSQSTLDIVQNVKSAIAISGNGTNWTPWVTFNSGAYKKFLSPGTAAGTVPTNASTTGLTIPGIGGLSVSGVVSDAISAFLKAMGLGSMKDMLERLGLVILGFTLVIVGIHLLASGGGGSQPINVSTSKEESDTGTRTSRNVKTPVGSHKTTTSTAKSVGADEAIEAAAVA